MIAEQISERLQDIIFIEEKRQKFTSLMKSSFFSIKF